MSDSKLASQRKPRLLWANPFCLLDTASGASMAINEMLIQLAKQGYEVMVIGATIFDAEKGITRLAEHWNTLHQSSKKIINITDGPLIHRLVKTQSIVRNKMTAEEEGTWYSLYLKALDEFKPDLVYYYGGQTLDMLIPDEARARGIPCAAYLGNGNYSGTRWCRDVDLILTDSHATAQFYKETQGIEPVPVGAFINPAPIISPRHERKHLLLVNPSLQKGAGIVVAIAMMLEKRRPDIIFEVVESRGNWPVLVEKITEHLGEQRTELNNVIITPNTSDMRPIYARARVLLALSLWWESFGRVGAEAMMNGVPAIYTNRGGLPEAIGDGGLKVNFPPECYEKPFTKIPQKEKLALLVQRIERFYDDEIVYQEYVERARHVGKQHSLETSTARLMNAFAPLVQKRAGDGVESAKPKKRPNKQPTVTTLHREIHADDVQVSVILGSWSSGSTAMTGYIERLGAYSCPPHVMTNDERTPNSHEPKVLRDSLVKWVDEMTLKMGLKDRQVFRDWFVKWLHTEKQKAAREGYYHVVLKHPLMAFFIEDIEAVAQPRWVVIKRSFEAIENTRLRRRWHPVYGKVGANVIYSRIFSVLLNHSITALCMNFEAFRQHADERARLEAYLDLTPTAEQRDQANVWIVM